MLSCSIWFSAPSFWMGGGLESRCLGRVYGADGAVRRTVPSAPYTRLTISIISHTIIYSFLGQQQKIDFLRKLCRYLTSNFLPIYLIYTHQLMHLCIILKKFKIYIKTLKTLLHVSIIRSSSDSTYCSFLKLYIKTICDEIHHFSIEQYVLPEDDRMIEICRRVLSVLMSNLNFFNIIHKCIGWCV